jgi:P27 family predicted phage terminase small subunit
MLQRGRKSAANLATLPAIEPKPPRIRPSPAPDHLSPAMSAWWNSVVAAHDLDQHRLRLLEAACGAWDRMVQARQAVAEHGLTFEGKDGPRPRPEVAIERDARIAFARLVRDLGLDPPKPDKRFMQGLGYIPPDAPASGRKPWE